MRMRWTVGLVSLIAGLGTGFSHAYLTRDAGSSRNPTPRPDRALSTKAAVPRNADLSNIPLYFVENAGQIDSRVAYYLVSPEATAYFTPGGVTFSLSEPRTRRSPGVSRRMRTVALASAEERRHWTLKLDFVGGDTNVVPRGRDSAGARVSYLIGPSEHWHSGLRTYGSVAYPQVWPGIDVVYSGSGRHLKYTMVLAAGADASLIRLRYRGATSVQRTAGGRLEVSTPVATLLEEKPYVYQDIEGRRVEVAADYVVEPATDAGGWSYSFRLGAYRRDLPLILDPFFRYAGYIGSSTDSVGEGVAVDAGGNAYVVGTTTISSSMSFPETVGVSGAVISMDAFVAKINAAGTGFVYVSYVGGLNGDTGYGIAVDEGGNAYVTGYTVSAGTFPHGLGFAGLTSVDSTFNGGTGDAYVAKLNPDGTALVYAGYIGGADDEAGYGIAVDPSHNAYVTGGTCSDESTFPDGDGLGALAGPDLTYNGGSGGAEYDCDAFVAKVNPAGDQLLYAGFIGGSNYDEASGIAVDPFGYAYVVGATASSQSTFPDIVGPDKTYNGGGDAFVAKVKVDGTGLAYAGYLGGGGKDEGNGIALRRDQTAVGQFIFLIYTPIVAGTAQTHATPFPTTTGPDTSHNGFYDAFVARVANNGSALLYSGFIGGSGFDVGNAVAVDNSGAVYVVGGTVSDQATFPEKSGPDTTYNGGGDAFIAAVNKDGSGLQYASYIGGNAMGNPNLLDDFALGVAVDVSGNAYVTGLTQSDESTFPDGDGFGTLAGPDKIHSGGRNAFIVKLGNLVFIPGPWFLGSAWPPVDPADFESAAAR